MSFHCQSLSYRQGDRILFDDLSASFPAAKLSGIIGPNGSGKSTLLRLLAGIDKAPKGKVFLEGVDLRSLGLKKKAKRIAYLPQSNQVYSDLTVLEVVLLGRAPYQRFTGSGNKVDRQIAEQSLSAVGLDGYAERWLHSLSGGELQRTMLARMLSTQTEILLLDEAITALDIQHSLTFLELCKQLCSKEAKTIVLAIHQLELAYRYCDFILLLGVDDAGAYLYGPTHAVMDQKNLERVFQVRLKRAAGDLLFYAR